MILLLCLWLLPGAVAGADSAAAPSPQAPDARESPSRLDAEPSGWIDIFPGSGLEGWTRGPWPATAPLGRAQWHVDAAAKLLVCDGDGGHDWLRYDRELGDAVFHVEWRFAPVEGGTGYNSGVFIRNAADISVWHQAQAGDAKGGFLFGNTLVSGLPQRVNLSKEVTVTRVKPAGEWNTYELTARGNTLSLWVNGAVTCELKNLEVARGYVGLEGEGYRIEFRSLKLKPLD
jgi:hypothetical protein